ncbi:proteasome activator complex subunit 4A-like [Phymastichus coffea]|uniref:proteasome activator complex subunit 4A-like n=1 Tax=Phymastichus coffea TaxID=108790 RepID=UPI00273B3D2D|nr:proteasome activator complex subunit 4A-like [Phymastichus coffea]XP_058802847.1 proteasome activator complex subunit 4A-like [Phymastichus coffea]
MNSFMRMMCVKGMSSIGSLSSDCGYAESAMIDMQLSTESLDLLDGSPYQTEIAFNKLLPYSDKLDEEADNLLAYIKENLGRCVITRDINPGCVYWSQMLTEYILLYGLRFTKEEHVVLVKLMYELMTIPKLNSTYVSNFGSILAILLKKKEVLSPDDLQLPWKPLFDLCTDAFLQKYKLKRDDPSLVSTLEGLIKDISPYFPPSATQEILDELMPKLCPLDAQSINQIFRAFSFLPVQLHPKYHSIGHELWLNEFMKLWKVYHNQSLWEYDLMKLIVRLAWNNIGYIDWNPYIPMMFTKFFRALNLPCYYKKIPSASYLSIESRSVSQWIASVLGGNSCAQTYLDKLLKSVETYLHPANQGPWVDSLQDWFFQLCFFFVRRIHKERFSKPTWFTPIPDSHKLSDANIDAFVDSMMPVAMIAVFNNRCSVAFFNIIKYLAILRPNKIIFNLLEKFSPTIGTQIEEHKATFAMNSMVAIARPLIQGSSYFSKEHAFVDGPSHALSILFSCLANIDPNDTSKCLHTFKLITTYVNQIPVVDCSQSRGEKTEDERLVCEETSRFEDFVLQLMDKLFTLIDSSALESVRLEGQPSDRKKNPLETMMEHSVFALFKSLLLQMSDAIFSSALNKLRHFIEDSSLETKVAGQLVAYLCYAFGRVNAQATMRAFVPYLNEKILDALGDGDDVLKEENLDNKLLYHLLLLQETLSTQGDALLPYMDMIIKVLDKVIKFKSLEGQQLAVLMLKNVLDSLCSVRCLKMERNLDDLNYPYWSEWGESVEINTAEIRWYMPGEQEITAAEMLFKRYFLPAVAHIQSYIQANKSDGQLRDELQRNLRIINKVLVGCKAVFPNWSEPALLNEPYQSCTVNFLPNIGNKYEINMPDRTNVRQFLVHLVTSLQEMILQNVQDDIKSLILIAYILDELSMNRAKALINLNSHRRYFRAQKASLENKITGDKGYFPTILLTRVEIQHALRNVQSARSFTATSKNIVMNLFKLSISQYSAIRSLAQTILLDVMNDYPNAYQFITDEIIEVFDRDTETHHDAYKGALYLLNKISKNLLKVGDWQMFNKLLPAFVLAKPSEKLTVIAQQTLAVQVFMKCYNTINIKLEVPNSCIEAASKLWTCGVQPISPPPTEQQIQLGIETLRIRGEENLKLYYDTLDKLLNAILEKNLHWRHRQTAMSFIENLIDPDHPLPTSVVRYFLNALICESIDERKLAWQVVPAILYQLKKEHPKVQIETPKQVEKGWNPGPRADNAWLQYNRDKLPRTAKEWDEPRYLHKNYVGYYAWSKKLEVYAPSSQQPNLDKNTREWNDQEKEIDYFFSDQQNVDKLIAFNTLEEKKGRDFFNINRCSIFKGIAINHGDAHLANFLPHLERMVQDKQESMQRCATEIICGYIRGAKHWNFQMTENLWKHFVPIIKVALSNITDETMMDWFICFSYAFQNRDPSRMHWLVECLMEESELAQSEVSFVECARLQVLRGAICQQIWRLSELLKRLIHRIESRLLDCPYDNVRDRLASMLVMIFNVNMKFNKNQTSIYPEIQDFVDKVYPRLEPMLTIDDRKSEKCVKPLRLLKTVCTWVCRSVQGSHFGAIPSFYKLYPLISQLENEEQNEELAAACSKTLATLGSAIILPEYVPFALQTLSKCSKSSSWSVRAGSIEFLQVLLFHNMSTLLSDKAWITEIRVVLMRLIKDERVEVRETAAQILNGMLHCTLIEDHETLLEDFKKLAKTKLRSRKAESSSCATNAIYLRHAGVLGMCAFIQAHPYDVPEIIPPIFEHLSNHLTDPEPIPTTIRKTLNDFKRTHCDGWTGLQGLAESLTPEQFALLQDLTVPPSYYA